MTWQQALQDYRHFMRIERGLSENTIKNYTLDIQKLVDYLAQYKMALSPLTIDEEAIRSFVFTISKQLNANSQARIISGLKGFFDYLIFEDYIQTNPLELIESPKTGRKLPDTLSTQEIDLLIQTIDRSKPEGERNRAILETLYGCGLRVSELVNLKLSNLFFEEGFIKITGKGNKQRFVPIANSTQKAINTYRYEKRKHQKTDVQNQDILFLNKNGKKLSRAMIFTIVKQLVKITGIKKQISPHTFRHSFATHLLEGGADLQAIRLMLGHQSITTTEIYMHINRTQLAEVIKKYHPRNGY